MIQYSSLTAMQGAVAHICRVYPLPFLQKKIRAPNCSRAYGNIIHKAYCEINYRMKDEVYAIGP